MEFGTIGVPTRAGMLWNECYRDEKALMHDLSAQPPHGTPCPGDVLHLQGRHDGATTQLR